VAPRVAQVMSVTSTEALWRSVQPLEYHTKFLAEGVRPDGRGPLKPRRVDVQGGVLAHAQGSARVRLGSTVVLAGAQCEPTAPTEAGPTQGRIIVSLDLAGVCSPVAAARSGSRNEREHAVLLELLQRTASGDLVDLESLCAVEKRAVWTCYLDLLVLEHDGNLTDACLLAMTRALAELRLPCVQWEEAQEALVESEAASVQVELRRPLVSCSFGVLGGHLLMDPSSDEEALLSCAFTVLVDEQGEFRGLHKPGGTPLTSELRDRAVAAALQRVATFAALLRPAT